MAEFSESFICPLTQQPMKDPVMDPEGNTYERVAIEDWLKRTPRSPLTNNLLTAKDLIPNRFVREAIEEHCKLHKLTLKDVDLKKLPKFKPKQPAKQDQKEVAAPAAAAKARGKSPAAKGAAKQETPKETPKEAASAEAVKTPEVKEADLAVQVVLRSTLEEDHCTVAACITPPNGATRTPADIVCVIDVSGSMGVNATVQNDAGNLETNHLSILDIVKHAVKTIIATLHPCDRLGLVSYSTKAQRVFGLIPMDEPGKAKAKKDLDTLDADGQTNLWDGLFTGLEVLRTGSSSNRLSAVFLLTDGQPNIAPSRGHLPMLQQYKEQYPNLLCSINTFGFGYSLDSGLLNELCNEGNGMYAFIPDAGFVGTCFVNTVSTLLSTMGRDVALVLRPTNGARVVSVSGSSWAEGENGVIVKLASLQYGQTRDAVFRLKLPTRAKEGDKQGEAKEGEAKEGEAKEGAKQEAKEGDVRPAADATSYLTATLQYRHWSSPEIRSFSVDLADVKQGDEVLIEAEKHRCMVVDELKRAMAEHKQAGEDLTGGQAIVKQLRDNIKASASVKHPHVASLLQDIEGQVTEAWSKPEWFKKWGIHYMPSLIRAHQLQQCNNFKDPGIQHYGGALFKTIQEGADDIFIKLPPPTQKADTFDYAAWGDFGRNMVGQRAAAAPVNMAMYYNRGGGCIAGECVVAMADGSTKRIREIVKGDYVMTAGGRSAEVECVVKHMCSGESELVALSSGLLLTPYHPVFVGDRWQFPREVGKTSLHSCPAVYNFVLSAHHTMVVNGVVCVTLGHEFSGEVVGHPFFGTRAVIHDLRSLRGGRSFASGRICFAPDSLLRDPRTGLLFAFDPSREL